MSSPAPILALKEQLFVLLELCRSLNCSNIVLPGWNQTFGSCDRHFSYLGRGSMTLIHKVMDLIHSVPFKPENILWCSLYNLIRELRRNWFMDKFPHTQWSLKILRQLCKSKRSAQPTLSGQGSSKLLVNENWLYLFARELPAWDRLSFCQPQSLNGSQKVISEAPCGGTIKSPLIQGGRSKNYDRKHDKKNLAVYIWRCCIQPAFQPITPKQERRWWRKA